MSKKRAMTREWFTVDKTAWGPGPWQDEPDKIQWVDRASDLDCLMVRRAGMGHWCGYVGVAQGHPMFELGYDTPEVDVHGGLTFAGACDENAAEGTGICHVPEPGRPDHVWWFGFDCAHAGDSIPGYAELSGDGDYRDRDYVGGEVTRLAAQVAAVRT